MNHTGIRNPRIALPFAQYNNLLNTNGQSAQQGRNRPIEESEHVA